MVERPANLINVEWSLHFNGFLFEALEIDLAHINTGKKQTRASSYGVSDVVFIFDKLVNGEVLYPVDARMYQNVACEYFIKSGFSNGIKYKIVFCICSDRPKTIGVLTMYKLRK